MSKENSLIYKGSVKDILSDTEDTLLFKFSDRYSIFDWGQMPDLIDQKGEALASMAASFFKILDEKGIKTHFISKTDKETIKVKKVNILKPVKIENQWDYKAYKNKPTNTLVPLEVIFRKGIPSGSSFTKRNHSKSYLANLGLNKVPLEGEMLEETIIEFSTKLEPIDRYLDYAEAQSIAGLSDIELEELINLTKMIANIISETCKKLNLKLWDGKFEFSFDEDRNFVLVDSIGLDELRITSKNTHLSKEILRQYYKNSQWLNSMPGFKNMYGDNWKEEMLKESLSPKNLSSAYYKLIQSMYTSFANDLESLIQEKNADSIKKWNNEFNQFNMKTDLENILIIGSGGREHAIAWKLSKSLHTKRIYITKENTEIFNNTKIRSFAKDYKDYDLFINAIKEKKIRFVVVGPEAPLVDGIVDKLIKSGIKVFGPKAYASKLESSKEFSKEFMQRNNIPTAKYKSFENAQAAIEFINTNKWNDQMVIKLDGLAAGKGVVVCTTKEEALTAVETLMVKNELKLKNTSIIIEEKLTGPEVSVFALIDKNTFKILGNACDYKRIRDNDQGPNTGGMGTYSPASWLSESDLKSIEKDIVKPFHQGLQRDSIEYNGVIFIGLMKTPNGLKVLEYNIRFGDPETQSLLPRIKNDFSEILYKTATDSLNTIESISLIPETAVHVVCAAAGYPGTEGVNVRKGDLITISSELKDTNIFFAGAKLEDNKLITTGGRVLGITAIGDSKLKARELVYNSIKNIMFEGMQYRNDIGLK